MVNNMQEGRDNKTSGLTQEERDKLITTMINYEDGLLTDKESIAMFQQLQEVTTFDLVRNLSRHYRDTLKTFKEGGTIKEG